MKQKFFQLLLMVLAVCASSSMMAYDFQVNGIYYNKSGNNATVTSGDNLYSGTITIPETVESGGTTYTVNAIAAEAFKNCIHLTGVNIGSNVKTIGYRAFRGCEELEEIVIPDEVLTFGVMSDNVYNSDYNKSETFVGCNALTSVTIGAKVASMGSGLFMNCTALRNVTIKDGCTYIGPATFKGCTKISSIVIPNTVEEIDYEAFYGCTGLKSISVPNSVTSIGYCAFQNCTAMSTATLGDGVTTLGNRAFMGCIHLQSAKLGSNLRTINYRAFYNCEELEEIVIPDEVVTFGVMSDNVYNSDYNKSETFVGCSALESATLGAKVASMGSGLFMDCTALRNVTIKEGCTYVGPTTFKGCTKIANIDIPNTVENIDYEAFSGCTALKAITIPESVTNIGYCAFQNCTAMTRATVGDGVTTLGNRAFMGCIRLQSATLGSSLRTINYRAFYNCEALESIVIPDGVVTFGVMSDNVHNSDYNKSETFVGCTSLESATIGKKVANMGSGLFMDCAALKNVTIKDGCAYIGPTTFKGCTKIVSIDIPNTVENIDYEAFNGCTALKTITIPESVTEIGSCAFYECTAMTKAIIGDGLTTLGNRAFYGCTNLKSVTLGSSLRTINYRAFYNCESLESIVIPDGVVTFGVMSDNVYNSDYNKSETFLGCSSLKSATIGRKVTNMGTGVFMNCISLASLTIKEGCKTIGGKCFNGCNTIKVIKNYCIDVPSTAANAFSSYTATLYVPASAIEDYKAADPWKKFGTIDDINNAPGDNDNKVATPTIAYKNGKLMFECATEGVEFVSEITDADITKYNTAEVNLSVTYNISVYATLAGMENSNVAKATLCWIDVDPKTEGIADVVAQVKALAILVRAESGQITVNGLDDGTHVTVYTIDGRQISSAVSHDGQALMTISAQKGGVVIIKIGEKTIKMSMK